MTAFHTFFLSVILSYQNALRCIFCVTKYTAKGETKCTSLLTIGQQLLLHLDELCHSTNAHVKTINFYSLLRLYSVILNKVCR